MTGGQIVVEVGSVQYRMNWASGISQTKADAIGQVIGKVFGKELYTAYRQTAKLCADNVRFQEIVHPFAIAGGVIDRQLFDDFDTLGKEIDRINFSGRGADAAR